MTFDLAFAISALPAILSGLETTAAVTVLSCIGASLLGFALEGVRRSNRSVGILIRITIDLIRSTPVLVQLYFLYFVLPVYGITLPPYVIGVLGLSIYYSGYLAEVFKSGIDSIPTGQFETAKAIGLRRFDSILFVIAPQMLRNISAPMGNYFVSILKATPYLLVIAVPEMLGRAMEVASDTFRYAEPLFIVGVVYFTLAVTIGQGVRLLEARLQRSRRR